MTSELSPFRQRLARNELLTGTMAFEFFTPGLAQLTRIVAAARRHGKPAGFLALDDAWATRYHAFGFRVLAYGLDSQLYKAGLAAGLAHLRGSPSRNTAAPIDLFPVPSP